MADALMQTDAFSVEPRPGRALAPAPAWRRNYVSVLVAGDFLCAALAALLAVLLRFGPSGSELATESYDIPYGALAVLCAPVWLLVQALSGSYEARRVGVGSDEYRRVLNAAVRVLAVVAAASFLANLELSRVFLLIAIPTTALTTLAFRHLCRKWLYRQRLAGRLTEDLLVVGSLEHVTPLIRHFKRSPGSGFSVYGAVVEGGLMAIDVDGEAVPVFGEPDNLYEVLANTQADAVAVTDLRVLPGGVRDLAWHLEGSGVDLLVAPAITDVAGPRIDIRPAAGLPLLHVEEPQFTGAARFMKDTFDKVVGSLLLLALAPVFATIALLIRHDSPGPAFFRQTRVGKDGKAFTVWKFRTMRTGADSEKAQLAALNEHDGVLFKIREDPRMTNIGRKLRRYSIDELPQLLNVITGEMSLVGPRPPVPSEVEKYGYDVRRRLLVKPGMTGLWQVSGRADLPWEEAVRLDLYYVENWSIALDITIMWKTVAAVTSGSGAY